MATSIQSSRWQVHTDELFREWGKAVSDGIRAVGLIQTEDMGQIDWETVATGSTFTSAGTVIGYEIWRFDDALQNTHPVFIKLEYGHGLNTTASGSRPYMWVTIGRGSDGEGAITGTLAPRRPASSSLHGATSTGNPGGGASGYEPIYVSSDGSSLCVVPRTRENNMASVSNKVWSFVIDRSRDHSGNPTAAGGVILTEGRGPQDAPSGWGSGTGIAAPAEMHAWTYAGDYTMGDAPAVLPDYVNSTESISDDASLANGDKAPIFPYVVTVPGHEPWQVLAAVTTAAGDAANGPFTATTLGRLRNYRSIPVNASHNRWATGQRGGYAGLCILWED